MRTYPRIAAVAAGMLLNIPSGLPNRSKAEVATMREWSAVFDQIGCGVVILDAEGEIEAANPAFAEMCGRRLETLRGVSLFEIVAPDCCAGGPRGRNLEIIRDQQQHTFECKLERADGAPVPTLLQATAVKDEAGRVEYGVATFIDIGDRKRAEEQLRTNERLASIGTLAAGIAHEINTPAQYVGDNIDFLQQSFGELAQVLEQYAGLLAAAESEALLAERIGPLKQAISQADIEFLQDEIPQALEQSREGVASISKIVRAMKEFSHPGTKEKKHVDLHRAIEATLTVCRNEWKYVAAVETDFDPTLPEVPCLAGEINQVILNLVVNAAHALGAQRPDGERGPAAEVDGKILLRTRRLDGHAEIQISDTGCGIPEAIRTRIFDPLFTTKDVGKGSGQGLSIARSIVVDGHGGTIHVESEVGLGTTFSIRLPLEADAEARADA